MVTGKRDESIYEAVKKMREDYIKSRTYYELYRDISKIKKMIETYYDLVKIGGGNA
jgi:glycyl-tRNA synthetase beta subunit